jgi:NADPH:quinone reductase-like Zn-dependent oxidoreductase
MRTIEYRRYGPPEVLQVREVERPVPGDHDVLVKVHATTVTAGDVKIRKADPMAVRLFTGLFRPRKLTVLGMEFSGIVAAVGGAVRGFRAGDRIFGSNGLKLGAYSEYVCMSASDALARMPPSISFEEAAAVPVGGNTALVYLRDRGRVRKGERVLIYGASGSVGTFAVQLAKHYGAEVTAACSSGNAELVRSLGADSVIDYRKEGPGGRGERYDLILDAVGKMPRSDQRSSLAPNGRFLSVMKGLAVDSAENMRFLGELIEEGAVRSVIDRTYPFDRIADAHRYVEGGHKKGNVVITVAHG